MRTNALRESVETVHPSEEHLDVKEPQTRRMIQEQVAAMVEHEAFRHSKRSAKMLEYLVHEAVEGHSDWLKERRIGVELFGRPSDYDTNADPVVRSTASEIRRRLAQFYQAMPGQMVLIQLVQGSYVPVFHLVKPQERLAQLEERAEALQNAVVEIEPLMQELHRPTHHSPEVTAAVAEVKIQQQVMGSRWNRMLAAGCICFVATTLAAAGWVGARWWQAAHDPVARFWQPILESSHPAAILMGGFDYKSGDPSISLPQYVADQADGKMDPVGQQEPVTRPSVMFQESEVSAEMASLMTRYHHDFKVHAAEATTLNDLRQASQIQLGIIDNPWAMRLLPSLRFHLRMDVGRKMMAIVDREHPEKDWQWSVPWGLPYSNSYKEYAMITRCHDPLTGEPVMLIGGLGLHGTQAVGEFVTSPERLQQLGQAVQDPNVNVQAILQIEVVNGSVAPAKVLAIHYWK